MDKAIKTGRYLFAVVSLVCAVFFIARCLHNNQVVATAEGNKIYYNNETYAETFEIFELEKDKCLGRVEFPFPRSKCKLYSLHEMPEYIFVDMGLDHRIYKRTSD